MTTYYSTGHGEEFTSAQVRSTFGFVPDNFDVNALNDIYGLYPINDSGFPPLDLNLYSGFDYNYTPNADGNTYDKEYVYIEKPLATAKENAILKLKDEADYDSIVALGGTPKYFLNGQWQSAIDINSTRVYGPYMQFGGESASIVAAQSYLAAASRIEPYKTMAANINLIATELSSLISLVNAATTVSEVRLAYRPVTGDIDITRSGNNITSGVFNSLSGASFSEMTLVIQATGYVMYYDENNGGFTALGGELPAGAQDVDLYAGSSLVATFTVPSGNATTNFTF